MPLYNAIQGNLGLGKAIEYFTSQGIPVSIPLNDTQKYDLIVDIEGSLKRISVKTSRNKSGYGTYSVQLRNCGGSSGKSKVRPFDNKSCDFIFVLTGEDKTYLIPTDIIEASNAISVGKKYSEYEVHAKKFSTFITELED